MFKNGYVVAVLADDRVLEEDSSNKICIPFGIEYKVRLINKNYERCAADLIINGDKIARFVLGAGETSDIERYIDDNLHSGSRFKFTHLNDSNVKDKNSFENGLIEVLYYKEIKAKTTPFVIKEEHHHHWTYPRTQPAVDPWKITYGNGGVAFGDKTYDSMQCNSISASAPTMSFGNCAFVGASTGQEGATVRGSSSDQKFQSVSGLEFDSTPTIIKLKLVNGDLPKAIRYCPGCGSKARIGDKYCPSCGARH